MEGKARVGRGEERGAPRTVVSFGVAVLSQPAGLRVEVRHEELSRRFTRPMYSTANAWPGETVSDAGCGRSLDAMLAGVRDRHESFARSTKGSER